MKINTWLINFLRFLLLASTAGAILILSLMSDPPDIANLTLWDKGNHFLAYLGLSAVFFLAFYRKKAKIIRLLILTMVCSWLYGALIEVLQNFTGRHMDTGDLLANTIGSITGCLCSWAFITFVSKVSSRKSAKKTAKKAKEA